MNRFLWGVLPASTVCWGDSKPVSSNVPRAEFPCVHSDLRVTFQLKAPEAHKVQVRMGKDYDMARTTDGTWRATLPPQVLGFHYYYLLIRRPMRHSTYHSARSSFRPVVAVFGCFAEHR
jgi:enterochelin esterase family protein